jgi:hypothetical protein
VSNNFSVAVCNTNVTSKFLTAIGHSLTVIGQFHPSGL